MHWLIGIGCFVALVVLVLGGILNMAKKEPEEYDDSTTDKRNPKD